MNREQDCLSDENIFGEGVSRSRREFFISVGKYSAAVAGAMMLAGSQLSIREAEAAERMLPKKSSTTSSRLKRQLPSGALQRGQLKTTPKLDPKLDRKLRGGLADKIKGRGRENCW